MKGARYEKNTNYHRIIAFLGISAFIFTEANHINTGYIISVSNEDIWLVRDSEENIQGKTEEELKEIYKFKGTFYDTKMIPSFITRKLVVGQKVKVFSDGVGDASLPGSDEAAFLLILN
ncbi:DUF3221 domain-containing protein [Bacillus sp. ISL-41]|uniref:DUF3221 domain-containing protein n=1 Tax=Bacillus sp. ISL-41 TaxID=2819127 RepID=UPI001BE72FDF|nr:DUF3221 domain-containing protein [Bacillus sp. ISL-41]